MKRFLAASFVLAISLTLLSSGHCQLPNLPFPLSYGAFESRNHDVPDGDVGPKTEFLERMFKDKYVRMIESGKKRILVFADPQTHEDVSIVLRAISVLREKGWRHDGVRMNADFENGDLRVHGSQDRIKTLVAFARALDSDLKLNTAQPKKVGPPAKNADSTLQIYSVADDSAEAVAKLLQEVYAATQTRITASSRDRIVVWADAETHREIAKQKVLTPPAPPVTKVITLGTLDAVRMAETLKASQQENVRKGLSIIAETQRNALILRGTEEQIREVTQLLASLNDGAGDQRNVRIINLEKGSAVTVAEAVQQLFGTLRDNPLRVIVPGNPPQAMKKDPKSAKPKPPVTLSAFGSRLTVLTDDPEAMAVVVDLVRMLQETTSGEFEVIQLRFAKAAHVAQILDEAYNHPPIRQVSGFGGGGRDGPRATPVERIRVVADPKTNTLLLRASPLDALAIRNLLSRALDTPEAAPTEAKKEDK